MLFSRTTNVSGCSGNVFKVSKSNLEGIANLLLLSHRRPGPSRGRRRRRRRRRRRQGAPHFGHLPSLQARRLCRRGDVPRRGGRSRLALPGEGRDGGDPRGDFGAGGGRDRVRGGRRRREWRWGWGHGHGHEHGRRGVPRGRGGRGEAAAAAEGPLGAGPGLRGRDGHLGAGVRPGNGAGTALAPGLRRHRRPTTGAPSVSRLPAERRRLVREARVRQGAVPGGGMLLVGRDRVPLGLGIRALPGPPGPPSGSQRRGGVRGAGIWPVRVPGGGLLPVGQGRGPVLLRRGQGAMRRGGRGGDRSRPPPRRRGDRTDRGGCLRAEGLRSQLVPLDRVLPLGVRGVPLGRSGRSVLFQRGGGGRREGRRRYHL